MNRRQFIGTGTTLAGGLAIPHSLIGESTGELISGKAEHVISIWLGGGTLFIFLLSMGKNVEGINHFLYDHLPLLNAFRSPSSALSISTFMMVALGIVGVHAWSSRRRRNSAVGSVLNRFPMTVTLTPALRNDSLRGPSRVSK